jgi:hypothetical protein
MNKDTTTVEQLINVFYKVKKNKAIPYLLFDLQEKEDEVDIAELLSLTITQLEDRYNIFIRIDE